MTKEIKHYQMQKYLDVAFVKCMYTMKEGSPMITVVAKEPKKELRIIPFYDEDKFNEFIKNFIQTYKFSRGDLIERMFNTVIVDDENKEYKIICDNKSVTFTVEYDPLKCCAIMTRSDIEDYSPIESEA